MKARLDEQLSDRLAEELRARGLDVQAVSEQPDMRGISDEQVMEAAVTEDRAVVTNKIKDFRPIAAGRLARGKGHSGLILLPSTRSRSRAAIAVLAGAIEAIMKDNPGGLNDSERWIAPL